MVKYLKEWLPYWGNMGKFLSILHITPDYLESERPDKYYTEGLKDVGSLVNGKDFLIEVKRKDKAIQQIQISSKVNAAAARCLTWSTPMGLVHKYTKLFGGRISEVSLVRLWGLLGIQHCDVHKWKDWVSQNSHLSHHKLPLKTAIDYVNAKLVDLTNDNDDSANIANDSSSKSPACTTSTSKTTAADDDEEESTTSDDASDKGTEIESDDSDEYEEERENEEATNNLETLPALNKAGNYIMCIEECLGQYLHRKQAMAAVAKDPNTKTPYLLTEEQIDNEALSAIQSGPLSSPEDFVAQLECHERLHKSFQANKIRRCSLSIYLLYFEEMQHNLLAWVGSPKAPLNHPIPELPPPITIRLA